MTILTTKLCRSIVICTSILSMVLLNVACSAQTTKNTMTHPELKPYPISIDGLKRHVIVLDEKTKEQESALKVELIAGKQQTSDGVNYAMMNYHITQHDIKGWGYPYYQVNGNGQTATTRIGVPKGTKTENKFVTGQSVMIDYNSRLPVVVYAPANVQIKYRIWQAKEFKVGQEEY